MRFLLNVGASVVLFALVGLPVLFVFVVFEVLFVGK